MNSSPCYCSCFRFPEIQCGFHNFFHLTSNPAPKTDISPRKILAELSSTLQQLRSPKDSRTYILVAPYLPSKQAIEMGPLPMPKSWDRFWKTPLILRPCIFEFNAHLLDREERSIKVCHRRNRRKQNSPGVLGSLYSPASSQDYSSSRTSSTLSDSTSSTDSQHSSASQHYSSSSSQSTSSSRDASPEPLTRPSKKRAYQSKKFGHLKDEELKALLIERGMYREEQWVERFAS